MLEKILKLSEEKQGPALAASTISATSPTAWVMRAVIELKRDADPEKATLTVLYKYSDLQITFGVNMVAIAEGTPDADGCSRQCSAYYIAPSEATWSPAAHDMNWNRPQASAHILAGLMVAVDRSGRGDSR